MKKVKITITNSNCRSGYFEKGQEYIVEDLCPPICHELWNSMYPLVYALQNGAELDYGNVVMMYHNSNKTAEVPEYVGKYDLLGEKYLMAK